MTTDLFSERLAACLPGLAPAGRRVVRFIDQNRTTALASSAQDLAVHAGTSDATVIRSIQALGFAGMGALRHALVAGMTPGSTPADDLRRTLAETEDVTRAVGAVLDAHDEAMAALRRPDSRDRIAAAVGVLHPAARIMVFGIGPSAALARYVAMLLTRFGRRSQALDATGMALADQLLDLRPGDGVLALAYGRPYREVRALFGEARRLGLKVVLVTDNPQNGLGRSADVVLAAQRGRARQVALHGATLVGLEALALGLAAADRHGAVMALDRLNDLRHAISGQQHDVGSLTPLDGSD